jgi:hypothetical protein
MAGTMHGFSHRMRRVAHAALSKVGSDSGQVRSRFSTVDFRELRVEARYLWLGLAGRLHDNGFGQHLRRYLRQFLRQGFRYRLRCAFSSGYFLSR